MVEQSSTHAKHELKCHFVWCPKCRRLALKGNIGKYVAKILYEVAERYDFAVLELAVMDDHVHMFVSALPNVSPAELIQVVKSITARKIFERFPGIKRILWGGALWERGYFVMSSGTGSTDEMIRKYINEQRDQSANDKPNLFG
ncbi:MAG: IS200/IS605 family transposase [Syntrophales bacterium]